jgi:hypothetical protein
MATEFAKLMSDALKTFPMTDYASVFIGSIVMAGKGAEIAPSVWAFVGQARG